MRLKVIFTTFWILLAGLLQAQSMISGTVTDAESGSPLPGATVQISGNAKGALTDASGRYQLAIAGANAIVRVQYLGYETQVERVFPAQKLVYNFALQPQSINLETTTITDQKVQRLYPDKQTMVIDYEFLKEDVLVIIYDPARKRNVLQLLSPNFSVLSEYDNAADPPRALYRDCLGASHCLSEHFAGQVDRGPSDVLIVRNDSLHLFQQFVAPCLARIDSIYYYATMPNDYVKQFTFIDGQDKRKRILYTCADKKAISSVEDETAMAKVDAGDHANTQRAGFQAGLNKSYLKAVAFPPIYVPILSLAGVICVFDHPHERILRFDSKGQILDFTPITYPQLRNWRREVFADADANEAYTLTEKDGFFTVHRIDSGTGALTQSWELPFPFVQKIRVRGSYIYFTYRNNSDDKVKRLFRLEM